MSHFGFNIVNNYYMPLSMPALSPCCTYSMPSFGFCGGFPSLFTPSFAFGGYNTFAPSLFMQNFAMGMQAFGIQSSLLNNNIRNFQTIFNNSNNTVGNVTSANYGLDNNFTAYSMPKFDFPKISNQSFSEVYDKVFANIKSATSSKLFSTNSNKKNSSTWNINTKTSLPQLADINYDGDKGKKLVTDSISNAKSGSTHYCAAYVKNSIKRCGLGEYINGNAYECADILAKNSNFKEINIPGSDLKELPAGCIIVYDKGAANYSSKYGHIEITTGTGSAVSDFINNNIRPSDNVRVFAPVKLQA